MEIVAFKRLGACEIDTHTIFTERTLAHTVFSRPGEKGAGTVHSGLLEFKYYPGAHSKTAFFCQIVERQVAVDGESFAALFAGQGDTMI